MDILLENLKAHIEAAALEKQREHSREYIKKWRTENKEKHRLCFEFKRFCSNTLRTIFRYQLDCCFPIVKNIDDELCFIYGTEG
jgi:hypothetical protein